MYDCGWAMYCVNPNLWIWLSAVAVSAAQVRRSNKVTEAKGVLHSPVQPNAQESENTCNNVTSIDRSATHVLCHTKQLCCIRIYKTLDHTSTKEMNQSIMTS